MRGGGGSLRATAAADSSRGGSSLAGRCCYPCWSQAVRSLLLLGRERYAHCCWVASGTLTAAGSRAVRSLLLGRERYAHCCWVASGTLTAAGSRAVRSLLLGRERYAHCCWVASGVEGTKRIVICKCPDSELGITLSDVNINRVTKIKYLGNFLSDDFKDDVDVERERRALAVRELDSSTLTEKQGALTRMERDT
ncbi:Endonuclease-reverse transcriptase [Operophtera brumata]|uniref:Endonuclease-reverse transcriptase n=1 Tax=Operophtera brumata TaxID=104452 RepID=A0A0L7LMX1_OPEBR|nr:Endonuclease-reverse transcriptase [Operophtera brumata]